MKQLIVATRNRHKVLEIKQILNDSEYMPISMVDAGIDMEIEENGTTFLENAYIKANTIFQITGKTVMADDSGLEVKYLKGAPGVHSQRFAGEGASDDDRNNRLLKMLEGVPFELREARFVCAIAVIREDGTSFDVTGELKGYIGEKKSGNKGFGYDPLFYLPEYGETVASLGPQIKNKISHRAMALEKMKDRLK